MREFLENAHGEDVAENAIMSTVVLVIVLGMVRMIGTNASTIFSQVGSALVVSGIQSARMRVRATDEARGDPIETVENTPESETIIALAYSVGRNLLVLKGVTQWSRPCERKISPNEIRGRTTEASSLLNVTPVGLRLSNRHARGLCQRRYLLPRVIHAVCS